MSIPETELKLVIGNRNYSSWSMRPWLLMRQLGVDFEIVIVDDGSEDESKAVLERWRARDPRIRSVHHATNRGYGAALRAGLREARGDFVFFSDADLQFDLREIADLLAQADAHDVEIVAGYRAPRRDPWVRRVIARAGDALVPVWREVDRQALLRVPDEAELAPAGSQVPHAPVRLQADARRQGPVRVEPHVVHRAARALLAQELLAALDAPQAPRLVEPGGGEVLARGVEL